MDHEIGLKRLGPAVNGRMNLKPGRSLLYRLEGGLRMEGHAQSARALEELSHENWVECLEWAIAPVEDNDPCIGPCKRCE